ncbi:MAG: hypothetical protein KA791_13540 [Flavobacteriales bacterium]|nr:hypothetical protein [Flavobacteriales bacterium]
MNDRDLVHQLRRLRRCVEQLQSEFEHQQLDRQLLHDIDTLMENGITADERAYQLRDRTDALRELVLVSGTQNHVEAARRCVQLKKVIDALIADIG